MTTLDIEIAMIKAINPRQNLTVPNVSWAFFSRQEVDILYLTNSNYATEIEIKVSKSDIKNDRKKPHKHVNRLIARVYFAVPEELKDTALELIPEHAGLYIIKRVEEFYRYRPEQVSHTRTVVHLERECKRNKNAVKWTERQRYELARLGTMRILGLKQTIQILNKNEQH